MAFRELGKRFFKGGRLLSCMQDNIVVSGDKKGQVAVWDFDKVHERTVYGNMHRALTNQIKFMGPLRDTQCASAASDGFLKAGQAFLMLHDGLQCLPECEECGPGSPGNALDDRFM